MNWSLKVARIAGIDVFLHWTFLILLGWVYMSNLQAEGGTRAEAIAGVLFILALFVCVLLHELGHALTARRYGIGTRSIVMLPIGGVATLEKMPEDPKQELWVALAGPAVNVVIAGILLAGLLISGNMPAFTESSLTQNTQPLVFLFNLLVVNVMLAVFNLIPAFPMDGGRVLRALLAMRQDRVKATRIAAQIGQFLAIIFVFLGFFYNFWLVFIGLFIFLGAGAESNHVATESVLSKYKVGDITMRQFTTFHPFERISRAIEVLLNGQEKEFLVTESEHEVVGILTRDDLIRGLQSHGMEGAITHIVNRNYMVLTPVMPLSEAYDAMMKNNASIAPVMDQGRLLGVLDRENIMEALMVDAAVQRQAAG